MGNSAQQLADMWNDVVDNWLRGGSSIPDHLRPWFKAYRGTGRGEVDPEAFPEPFLGELTSPPAAVVLSLNPGKVFPDFQYRDGQFAREIRDRGSYSRWAAEWPYLRGGDFQMGEGGGPNFHKVRWNFLKNWYQSHDLPAARMLAFELYPWHSLGLTAPILFRSKEVQGFVERFIWEPIIDSGAPYVFAFGKDWFPVVRTLADEELVLLGHEGEPCPFRVADRTVLVARANDMLVIASKTHNYAAPLPRDEITVLQGALLDRDILADVPRWAVETQT